MAYAVVLGEALVDLLDGECAGQPVYRQAIGGAPLNVAVGVARLGSRSEFVGSLGDDLLGARIRAFLTANGVGQRGVVQVAAPTTLAVATFDGAEPEFRFYGAPPSYGLLGPSELDPELVCRAEVLYCGSIGLLCGPLRATARRAWSLAGGLRVFDPNVRPRLLADDASLADLRAVTEEFAASADLVKLSAVDAEVLYGDTSPEDAASRLRVIGAAAVVVTCGARGAVVASGDGTASVPAPVVRAVDATGAGDSVMSALIHRLLAGGVPRDAAGWRDRVAFALAVAGLVCERRGGAVAMPTLAQVRSRFGLP